jgi:hypothetical protein
MNLKPPRPPPFPLGAKVEYSGPTYSKDPEGKVLLLKAGMVGVVVDVQPGRQGTGRLVLDDDFDELKVYDETSDGASVVAFETGVRRLVRCSSIHYREVK